MVTLDVDQATLSAAVDRSLSVLAEAFNVSKPSFRFSLDEASGELFNAIYYPYNGGQIVFYRVNPDIVVHEFGHHWLEATAPSSGYSKDEHEAFARAFQETHKAFVAPIWVAAGLV